jgi:hypothetical protein
MYQGLKNHQLALDTERRALGTSTLGGETWDAAQRLRALARVMLGETVDWKTLYQLHEVTAG